ncbi:MAG TPA: alanine racemase, partial [Gemmatimonadaceae bacterium]|nr:alanine racemase [Gemmatimonadaceae bacterium]
WHLAIDTGMNRAGGRARSQCINEAVDRVPARTGAFTHFHSAELDDGSLEEQERHFAEALSRLPARPAFLHADNSAAIVRRQPSAWHGVRPGVFLYGVGSGAALQPEPVVSLRARIMELRDVRAGETVSYDATWRAATDRRIATLACGYADGYRRNLGNRGHVILHGHAVPVAGLVTMDMTMIDVTDVPCAPGDVATLLGTDGTNELTAESVAQQANLSPYELLTGLRQRLPRFYHGGAA